jgi:hypothetical protein
MHDLLSLVVIIIAFGGLSIIGIVLLSSGLFAAQRTSSVIACAAMAAMLFAVQLGSMYFWQSFGVGFGGESGTSAMIHQWGSVAAIVLVGGFLVLKLPGSLGRTVEAAHWLRDGAKISAVTIVAYVLYLLVDVVSRSTYPPASEAPPVSLAVWMTTLVGLVLAGGLWRHRPWAWYAAVACAVYAIIRIVWPAFQGVSDITQLLKVTPVGMSLLLLVSLLGVLLLSNARKLCIRQTPSKKA